MNVIRILSDPARRRPGGSAVGTTADLGTPRPSQPVKTCADVAAARFGG